MGLHREGDSPLQDPAGSFIGLSIMSLNRDGLHRRYVSLTTLCSGPKDAGRKET